MWDIELDFDPLKILFWLSWLSVQNFTSGLKSECMLLSGPFFRPGVKLPLVGFNVFCSHPAEEFHSKLMNGIRCVNAGKSTAVLQVRRFAENSISAAIYSLPALLIKSANRRTSFSVTEWNHGHQGVSDGSDWNNKLLITHIFLSLRAKCFVVWIIYCSLEQSDEQQKCHCVNPVCWSRILLSESWWILWTHHTYTGTLWTVQCVNLALHFMIYGIILLSQGENKTHRTATNTGWRKVNRTSLPRAHFENVCVCVLRQLISGSCRLMI